MQTYLSFVATAMMGSKIGGVGSVFFAVCQARTAITTRGTLPIPGKAWSLCVRTGMP